MTLHLVLGRELNLDDVAARAAAGAAPGHVWVELRDWFGARVHTPAAGEATLLDRLRAKLSSRPEHWELARRVLSQARDGDVVYCTGEDVGMPMAAYARDTGSRARLVVCVHNLDRPRARLALRAFGMRDRVRLWLAFSRYQAEFLCGYLRVPSERVCYVAERTETDFFTPGPASADKARPVVASVGLEKRDYRTLAAACAELDVDVRISGFSSDAPVDRRAFPRVAPANMTQRFYEWTELRQLYRDADVVVVGLRPATYAAGITTYLEALACRRPVILTRTDGMKEYCDPPQGCRVVEPFDVAGMRRAVEDLLQRPVEAERLAATGHELVQRRHAPAAWLELVASRLGALGACPEGGGVSRAARP